MRKVSFLIAICLVLSVMVAAVVAQGPPPGGGGQRGPGGPGGAGGPGGQRGAPAVQPAQPAGNGEKGAADLPLIMQWVTFTSGGMRGKVTAGDAPGVAEDLGKLQTLFTSAQTALAKEKVTGAADLAKAAATAAGDAQKVAKGGKVDAMTTKAVTDSCGGCHGTYREKDASGAYQLKK